MTIEHEFVVDRDERLDRLVAAHYPELSRSQARRLIEDGRVTVDGEPAARASDRARLGTSVRVEVPVVADFDLRASEVALDVIYEDEETLVIDKTPGIIVHPREGVQGVTLVNVLRAHYPEVRDIDDTDRPGVVHRLDRDTSGVMAFAKSEAAQEAMKDQWRARETVKIYLAIVEGEVDPPKGIIDAPLGADPTDERRRAVVEGGKPALTEYTVLEQYGREAALVEVRIFTGRTHQIRVHMEAIGHPVLGDPQYGRASNLIGRQALHAWRLGFALASTGEFREFEAPMPQDMCDAVQTLRERHGVQPSRIVA